MVPHFFTSYWKVLLPNVNVKEEKNNIYFHTCLKRWNAKLRTDLKQHFHYQRTKEKVVMVLEGPSVSESQSAGLSGGAWESSESQRSGQGHFIAFVQWDGG